MTVTVPETLKTRLDTPVPFALPPQLRGRAPIRDFCSKIFYGDFLWEAMETLPGCNRAK